MIKVFLADDHEVLRDGLKALIQNTENLEVIGEAADGNTTVQMVAELRPDVVVMDISMPGCNGFGAFEQIKKLAPEIKVVFLTAHEDPSFVHQFVKAGAAGYILKRSASQELIKSLFAIQDSVYIDPAITGQLLVQMRSDLDSGNEPSVKLSARERKVLEMVAQGFSNKEIANSLSLSVRTVETYKARSMTKLGFTSRSEIVRYALKQGWLSQEPSPSLV